MPLFKEACPSEYKEGRRIIQSSIPKSYLQDTHISPSRNGFVMAAFHAYSSHHHLTIRPEDVWFSILSQLNFYINAHAEELRSYFVSHAGQKELTVFAVGTIDTVDFGAIAKHMTNEIQKNVKDEDLQKWIMPDFSTTTESDRAVAAVLMMGAMQKYFSFSCCLTCGIPSVTLLGEREDWEKMIKKLDKLCDFGDEPTIFASLLRPVLRNFIATFDAQPDPSSDTVDFWSKIASEYSGGSGPSYLTGWITAFCMWDADGKFLYRPGSSKLEFEGVKYHRIEMGDIPAGMVSVPLLVDDNGTEYKTKMIAGSFGIQVTSSGQKTDATTNHVNQGLRYDEERKKYVPIEYVPSEGTEEAGLDSLQPLTGWIMYELKK
ncbi:hypothetical protein N0V94_002563 [Neodidymelliopsis sp. IMI 364377]|nr:hypothetical protein N0V94_002563 [Neodidymelliopsis sp. IMI 364377]